MRSSRTTQVDCWLEPASWEDRRCLRRIDASIPAMLSRPNLHRTEVALLDISARGCRIKAGGLRAGDRVWIGLDPIEPVCAHVAWAGFAEAGLEFRQPLHPAVVTHLASLSSPDTQASA